MTPSNSTVHAIGREVIDTGIGRGGRAMVRHQGNICIYTIESGSHPGTCGMTLRIFNRGLMLPEGPYSERKFR